MISTFMKKALVCFILSCIGTVDIHAQSSYHYDVNNDGEVNVMDAVLVVNYILGNPSPEAIDMGLPSGIKWATFNVGATKPEEDGNYYAWGETEKKEAYSWSTYTHCDGSSSTCHDIGTSICATQYDVAHVAWGGSWRMPTADEMQELLDYCNYEWVEYHGVNGLKLTSKDNGNIIFLPAAGDRWGTNSGNKGSYGYYWTGTLSEGSNANACRLNFNGGAVYKGDNFRYRGFTVRPVCE